MKVIKRNGSIVNYDRNKIFVAIQKANESVDVHERIGEDKIYTIIADVEMRATGQMHVEEIQDIVESGLWQQENMFLQNRT